MVLSSSGAARLQPDRPAAEPAVGKVDARWRVLFLNC